MRPTKQKNGSNGAPIDAVPAAGQVEISIPAINIQLMTLRARGVSGLLVHNFNEKGRRQMLDKQKGVATQKKAPKDPEADFLASLYPLPGETPVVVTKGGIVRAEGRFGFPAAAFKNAMVSACRYVEGVPMTIARGAFHVVGDLLEIEGDRPVMHESTVRIGKGMTKVADVRHRGLFPKWSVQLVIRYNANVMTPAKIANLLNNAGFSVGIGEHRPEKSGSFGMFEVGNDNEVRS